ncbi:MAG TPA: isoprenylcysteine carboxylmethyltransferase family protein [Terriglobales bacterium]|nr:isoprenylcysteine carboxylmethyltransferase family protein [Terriglobales bacterium]
MGILTFKGVFLLQLSAAAGILAFIIFAPGEWNLQRWAGVLIAIPATVLLFVARFQLGRSFAVRAEAHELVTHGIYSKIRNPIYIFSGLLLLALALTVNKPALFLMLLALVPVQILRARKEAAVLEAKFGDEYRRYRQKTWL